MKMTILTVSAVRTNLYQLIDQVTESYRSIYITGKLTNAVLLLAEAREVIQETLHYTSFPWHKTHHHMRNW